MNEFISLIDLVKCNCVILVEFPVSYIIARLQQYEKICHNKDIQIHLNITILYLLLFSLKLFTINNHGILYNIEEIHYMQININFEI